MKMITAIVKPFRLDDVRAALQEIGVQGMTKEGNCRKRDIPETCF